MSTATVDNDRPALTVVDCPEPEVPVESPEAAAEDSNAVRARDRARGYLAQAGNATRVFRPPDIWQHDRPSLKATYRHALWGEHVPPGSIARGVYLVLWALVCAPPVAVFYLLAWAHERPLRVIGFWVTVWALWQIAPVRAVLGFVAHWNVPAVAAHLITTIGGS